MKMVKLSALLSLTLLCACEDPRVKGASAPQKFNLPDGTPVECYKVERSQGNAHWIYVVRGSDTTTGNHRTSGKNKRTNVEATVEAPKPK